MTPTRGERNNNPGNIRISKIKWRGKITGTDTEFETFESPEDGIRAIAKILLTYQDKYNLKTIQQMICRWAPPAENNTSAYVNAVCADCCEMSNVPVSLHDPVLLTKMVTAIIRHENGRVVYSNALIEKCVRRVLS